MVPVEGIEPTRPYGPGILNPVRLPIPATFRTISRMFEGLKCPQTLGNRHAMERNRHANRYANSHFIDWLTLHPQLGTPEPRGKPKTRHPGGRRGRVCGGGCVAVCFIYLRFLDPTGLRIELASCKHLKWRGCETVEEGEIADLPLSFLGYRVRQGALSVQTLEFRDDPFCGCSSLRRTHVEELLKPAESFRDARRVT
jgi:hypothetical protein